MNDPTAVVADFERDRWGRPLIDGRPYVRSSAAAKTIEDTYNLELWARRNVAYGMSRDASLAARMLAIGGTPSTWTPDERKAVNKIHTDAAAVALAHKAADIGTAVHRLTERLDRGEQVDAGPYEPDLEAYTNALITHGYAVDAAYVECRMVCDELQLAGTADRLVRAPEGTWRVADLKTGESVDYGALGWSAQLAAYAHSVLYDPATQRRLPTPALDRSVGVIIHLPAGTGRCTLYELDLVAGYRAAQLANEVRAVRRTSKGWISKANIWAPAPAPVKAARPPLRFRGDEGELVDDDQIVELIGRITALPDADRARIHNIAKQAHATVGSINFRLVRRERRYWIARGLYRWTKATKKWEEDVYRGACAYVTGDEACHQPGIPLGTIVGMLTVAEAKSLADMANRLDQFSLTFSDDRRAQFALV